MPIPLGILAAAGFRPTAGGSYELIETITVGSGGAASVTFSNLNTYSTTYQHLQIRYLARSNRADNVDFTQVTFNADSAANYSIHYLRGDGGSVSSLALASQNFMWGGFSATTNSASNIFANGVIDILDPYEAKNKTIRSLSGLNGVEPNITLFSGNWRNTTGVTSVTVNKYGSLFVQGSRFSIYGLKGTN